MLYAVSPHNREIYAQYIDDYFRLRKEVLIDQKGWDLKSIEGKETDQFDHDQAHYLIYKSPQSNCVTAGVRLMPTTVPNLTVDIFSHLIDSSHRFAPSSEVWECSRFVTKPSAVSTHKEMIKEATFMLFIGMLEYGLRNDVHAYLALTDVRLERIARMNQWYMTRLGAAQIIGNTLAATGFFEVSRRIGERIRRNSGISKNIFWEERVLSSSINSYHHLHFLNNSFL